MEKRELECTLLAEMQTGAATMENSMEISSKKKKKKKELPFDPAIPLLGLCPKNPETTVQKNLCTPMFIAPQFTIGKCWQQPKCPSVNEWIKNYGTFTQWNTMQQKERRNSYPS